jgi:hypothetical protein
MHIRQHTSCTQSKNELDVERIRNQRFTDGSAPFHMCCTPLHSAVLAAQQRRRSVSTISHSMHIRQHSFLFNRRMSWKLSASETGYLLTDFHRSTSVALISPLRCWRRKNGEDPSAQFCTRLLASFRFTEL